MFYERKHTSVGIAKQRLHMLLSADRCDCTPKEAKMMEQDLYDVLARYLSLTPDNFQVTITSDEIYIQLTGEKH